MKTSTDLGKCERCGGKLATRIVPKYRNDLLMGIEGIVILNAVEEIRCTKCGHVAAAGFSNLEGLIAAVAVARVVAPQKLRGRDVRFLRKALGWSSKELAAMLEVRDETVSRWENEKEPLGPTSEKLLRLMVAQYLAGKAPALEIDEKQIATMRIRAVREPAKLAEMRFQPIEIKVAHKREITWQQVGEAA
ncbi:MAG: helix-turn-helix domain-containing protein [Candidatus Binataceae bacterium]